MTPEGEKETEKSDLRGCRREFRRDGEGTLSPSVPLSLRALKGEGEE